ncbi:orotidine 5'-phosphate decarboxylase [Synechococcus sp. PCC 7335]|uniref:orotidine-5'-phosphate decarboxylase n=1 Tax=Synechococcus sp. (strain ATCC 29403 / PCC 7335) TaxID=91464 RepID=UPI00017EB108|nr:orotidine-5'-phosphate decarboxylase [Synechococcus sp. PCC 7335]EDX87391.1 orotidine 5'-phosphate decarboxylase [Synechococcus sp. PCC 7335]
MTSLERVEERIIDRIIVPLDVASQAEAIALVDRLPQVTFWKVGLELFVSSGPAILSQLKSRGKRIFLDLKLHDIPNTMAGAGRAAGRYGVELLTVHAAAGGIALSAVKQAAIEGAQQSGNSPPRVIAVTLLTSISAEVLALELNVTMTVEDYAEQMAQLAKASGLTGAVCSPHEATALKKICGEGFRLVCPGVRPRWAQKGDQQRAMTPSDALAAGADYLVIGRPITQAADPAAAFERICAEMAG